MKQILCCFLVAAFCAPANAQLPAKAEYLRRVKMLQANVETIFLDAKTGYYKEFNFRDTNDKKAYSYLWPLCGLIQAATEYEATTGREDYFDSVLQRIQAYKDDAPPAKGYNAYLLSQGKEDRFYDDNQWIGIACLDAYSRTKKARYLNEAKEIYRFMMTGFDTVSGGGLYWKEGDRTTKNTCSNGPGVLVALGLYKATGEKGYLDTALLLYNWTRRWLRSPEGMYYDNVQLPAQTVDKLTYTYNTGTMLQSAVLLYEITGHKDHLAEAKVLAEGAYKRFFRKGRWPDHYWFNVVLLRGYEALRRHNGTRKYMNAFVTEGEAIWKGERDANGLIGKKRKKAFLDSAAVMEIFARLVRYVSGK